MQKAQSPGTRGTHITQGMEFVLQNLKRVLEDMAVVGGVILQ